MLSVKFNTFAVIVFVKASITTVEPSNDLTLPVVSANTFCATTFLHGAENEPKSSVSGVFGTRLELKTPLADIVSSGPSPKLIFPVAVIVPSILMLPVPTISFPFRSMLPSSAGKILLPPTVVPSPTNKLFVSVV